jgi:hypothetical protein
LRLVRRQHCGRQRLWRRGILALPATVRAWLSVDCHRSNVALEHPATASRGPSAPQFPHDRSRGAFGGCGIAKIERPPACSRQIVRVGTWILQRSWAGRAQIWTRLHHPPGVAIWACAAQVRSRHGLWDCRPPGQHERRASGTASATYVGRLKSIRERNHDYGILVVQPGT